VVVFSLFSHYQLYVYIYSGLAEQFGFSSGQTEEEADESMGLADKFQLVKQVAQTVQNTSGTTSDTLEKLRNLWLWHQPEATRKLYIALLVFLLVTLFLPNSYTLTFIGTAATLSLFLLFPLLYLSLLFPLPFSCSPLLQLSNKYIHMKPIRKDTLNKEHPSI
jgi:hypothetical protein